MRPEPSRIERKEYAVPTSIRQYQLIELLDRVRENSNSVASTAEFQDIELAAETISCPVSQIIALVADGKLAATRDGSKGDGLLSVKVDPSEVSRALESSGKLHSYDREIIYFRTTADPLISKGYLRLSGSKVEGAKRKDYFSPTSFARMRFFLMPLTAIARAMEVGHRTAREKLIEAQITPAVEIQDENHPYSINLRRCYYRIRDIESLI